MSDNAAVRSAIMLELVREGLISHDDAIALLAGKPIKPQPWWVRARRWVIRRLRR